MTIQLENFFRNISAQEEVKQPFQRGFVISNMDLLLQQAHAARSVHRNYLYDLLYVEKDPNYKRRNTINILKTQKLLSIFNTSTTITNTVLSLATLLKIEEFIPDNIKQYIYNLRDITEIGQNYLTSFQNGDIFSAITQTFLNDLLSQYSVGGMSFTQINNMYSTYKNGFLTKDSVKNDGIRSLLSIPLFSLLPSDYLEIFTAAQYLDKLLIISNYNYDFIETFTEGMTSSLNEYSQNRVSQLQLIEDYNNKVVNFDDPLGVVAADSLKEEIKENYNTYVIATIEEESVAAGLTFTSTQISELADIINVSLNYKINTIFDSNLGLPSISNIVNGMEVETHNKTVYAFTTAFDEFSNYILKQVDVKYPEADISVFDYLMNLRKYLRERTNLKRNNVSQSRFEEIDAYIKSVVRRNAVDENYLKTLYENLDSLLNE